MISVEKVIKSPLGAPGRAGTFTDLPPVDLAGSSQYGTPSHHTAAASRFGIILFLLSGQSTPNIHQHAHQREYILIDTKIVKIGYPEAELGQEGHLTLLDLM